MIQLLSILICYVLATPLSQQKSNGKFPVCSKCSECGIAALGRENSTGSDPGPIREQNWVRLRANQRTVPGETPGQSENRTGWDSGPIREQKWVRLGANQRTETGETQGQSENRTGWESGPIREQNWVRLRASVMKTSPLLACLSCGTYDVARVC